ncbi:hypothetical protein F5148DRAFT_275796 [Russula earlei]|uniref:Uncharacterized protein n=1 Tax=Russula earlei TaxID=71964 RepID=A0ACC0U2P2_9AGAM|nr:hypothetical protein F5148DRAFT_275796 [Russula earlei]
MCHQVARASASVSVSDYVIVISCTNITCSMTTLHLYFRFTYNIYFRVLRTRLGAKNGVFFLHSCAHLLYQLCSSIIRGVMICLGET